MLGSNPSAEAVACTVGPPPKNFGGGLVFYQPAGKKAINPNKALGPGPHDYPHATTSDPSLPFSDICVPFES